MHIRFRTQWCTGSSGSRNSAVRVGVIAALLLLPTMALAVQPDVQSAGLEFVPVRDELFERVAESATPFLPQAGQVAALGRFDHPLLSIQNINQITVIASDGRAIPLQVESPSIVYEFDRIVSLRFFFLIAESEAAVGAEPFQVRWGAGISADNIEVDKIVLDPKQRALYREFRWRQSVGAPSESASVSTIDVIADSTAEYHFLWYLLPMAVIFAVLTIRKIRAHHPTG